MLTVRCEFECASLEDGLSQLEQFTQNIRDVVQAEPDVTGQAGGGKSWHYDTFEDEEEDDE